MGCSRKAWISVGRRRESHVYVKGLVKGCEGMLVPGC
jgi:hypothetical protein